MKRNENCETMENLDQLNFCLQQSDSTIIATILVNNIPLYDYIICKHAALGFANDVEKKNFIAESYNFKIYPQEDLTEEMLFYYNFPENLMHVDFKHEMVGFSPYETLVILSQPFLKSNEIGLTEKELNDFKDDLSDYTLEESNICLVHTCGSTGCSHIKMKLDCDTENNTVKMHSFQSSFGEIFHPEVQFRFDKEQYFSVLKSLKKICDYIKDDQDYLKFTTERYYKENF